MHLILDELSECVAGRDNVENEYIAKELGQSIKQFVSTLPERDANVFLRRYFFCESLSEIAKLSDDEYFSCIEKLLVKGACEGEGTVFFNEKDRARLPEGFIKNISEKLSVF